MNRILDVCTLDERILDTLSDVFGMVFVIIFMFGVVFVVVAMVITFVDVRSKRGKAVIKAVELREKLIDTKQNISSTDRTLRVSVKWIRRATKNKLSDYTENTLLENLDELHEQITALTGLIDELNETITDMF